MSLRQKFIATEQPTADEWGIYDPEHSGLPAVFRKVIARFYATDAPTTRAMRKRHTLVKTVAPELSKTK